MACRMQTKHLVVHLKGFPDHLQKKTELAKRGLSSPWAKGRAFQPIDTTRLARLKLSSPWAKTRLAKIGFSSPWAKAKHAEGALQPMGTARLAEGALQPMANLLHSFSAQTVSLLGSLQLSWGASS